MAFISFHPFQSGFRHGYESKTFLIVLVDDLCWDMDKKSSSLLILLDLSAGLASFDHGVFLEHFFGLGLGGIDLQWFLSFHEGGFQKVCWRSAVEPLGLGL